MGECSRGKTALRASRRKPNPLKELANVGIQEQFYKNLNVVFPFIKFDLNLGEN